MRDEVINEYFEWLCDKVRNDNYQRLLVRLHDTEFTYILDMDENRANDGISLRRRFGIETGYDYHYISGPCTVLEMMVALCIRCEETIMTNDTYGDRTAQWFWEMVLNLGLIIMTDDDFDKKRTDEIIKRFLSRRYTRNGRGGLFVTNDPKIDMRDVEIWYQMCGYLDELI